MNYLFSIFEMYIVMAPDIIKIRYIRNAGPEPKFLMKEKNVKFNPTRCKMTDNIPAKNNKNPIIVQYCFFIFIHYVSMVQMY